MTSQTVDDPNQAGGPAATLDLTRMVGALGRPDAYPWQPRSVELVETHVSWVFLAGERVVKLKRPVDFGFVDHTSLAARRRSCLDEVRLNRRLTDGVYLGVVPVRATEGGWRVGEPLDLARADPDEPDAAEWATLMRRLPAERMLDRLLAAGHAPPDLAARLAGRLVPFHAGVAAPCGAPDETGESLDAATTAVVTENLSQVEDLTREQPFGGQVGRAVAVMRSFVARAGPLLRSRSAAGWIREGHGDLRAEHACLEDEHLQVFDCVEFSRAIRCADVVSDLAYLLVDLDRFGAGDAAAELVARYRAAGLALPDDLIRFYRVHRALVKAKILCLEARTCDPAARPGYLIEAATFVDLATADALVCRPVLLAMTGLSGTGKSFVAASLARALRADLFSSDAVRRELNGASGPAPVGWQEGIYAPEKTAAIYDRLFALAAESLQAGRPVVLDASFLEADRRDRLAVAAEEAGVPLVLAEAACDEATALRRIRERAARGDSPSEAYEAIYRAQRRAQERDPVTPPPNARFVSLDTSADGPTALEPVLLALADSLAPRL